MRRRRSRPTHPGGLLRDSFLPDYGLSAVEFAVDLGLPLSVVEAIFDGSRPLDADVALRLGRYFGSPPGTWMSLQSRVDFFDAMEADGAGIEAVKPISRDSRSVADREPLPDDVRDELERRIADLDDPTRWMVVSVGWGSDVDDEMPLGRMFYQVRSGCWAMEFEGGTAFKREPEARAVAEHLGDRAVVMRVSSEDLDELRRVAARDTDIRKRHLRRSRESLEIWKASDYLESEEDMVAYLEAAAEDGDSELLSVAVSDVLSAMRGRYCGA